MIFIDILVMLALSSAAGCGLGGGGLLVVYLTLAKDADQVVAQALNLLFYILSATSSTFANRQKTGKSFIRAAVFCSVIALPGAYLGALARGIVSDSALRVFFWNFTHNRRPHSRIFEYQKALCGEKMRKKNISLSQPDAFSSFHPFPPRGIFLFST